MALHDITIINGVTKRELADGFLYIFPLANITTSTTDDLIEIYTKENPSNTFSVGFDGITEQYSTADAEAYVDYLASNRFFFETIAKTVIQGANGEDVNAEFGSINTHHVDVHGFPVNIKFHKHDATVSSTLATAASVGATTLALVSGTGFLVGQTIAVKNAGDDTRMFVVTVVATNTLTLDAPIDIAMPIGATVEKVDVDLSATAGTLAAPKIFILEPPANEVWHITRLIFSMTHSAAADLSKFGSITALTNGVVIRDNINSAIQNIANWKTNNDIKQEMYDVEFTDRAGGGSPYGTSGRFTLGKLGVALKLDGATSDKIEVLIQDDLTTLGTFGINGQGHIA